MTIQAIAGRARRAGETGKKSSPRFLRAAMGREPAAADFASFKREIERQDAIHKQREIAAGTYRGNAPDVLRERQRMAESGYYAEGRIAVEAQFRRRKARIAAAEAALRAGEINGDNLRAAELGYLAEGRVFPHGKRVSWCVAHGSRCSYLSERECLLLGKTPGPANV